MVLTPVLYSGSHKGQRQFLTLHNAFAPGFEAQGLTLRCKAAKVRLRPTLLAEATKRAPKDLEHRYKALDAWYRRTLRIYPFKGLLKGALENK